MSQEHTQGAQENQTGHGVTGKHLQSFTSRNVISCQGAQMAPKHPQHSPEYETKKRIPLDRLQPGIYKSCQDALKYPLNKRVRCVRLSLLESFAVTLLDVHIPLYFSLKRPHLTSNTTVGGDPKTPTDPQFISHPNVTYRLKPWIASNQTQEGTGRDQCLDKIPFILSRGEGTLLILLYILNL